MAHAEAVIISEKKNSARPVIPAPIMLVATKVIPRSITEVSTVPRIPIKMVLIALSLQAQLWHEVTTLFVFKSVAKSNIARYTTAIPSNTHKKAGVIVMVAVNRKNAVTTPTTRLARNAIKLQVVLQLHIIIFSPPFT